MSALLSEVAAPTQNAMPETNRRSADFHPSIWGDHFLTYASDSLVQMRLFVHFVVPLSWSLFLCFSIT
jgi:hypothetical protein